jgi:hypothetical protein
MHVISCEAAIELFHRLSEQHSEIPLGRMVKLIRDIECYISEVGSSVCLYVSGFQ